MHSDISKMVELQKLWDRKMELEAAIARHEQSISFWQKKLADTISEIAQLKEHMMKTELDIRAGEKKMFELEEKIGKLNKRRDAIKTEKELAALESELSAAGMEKDGIETQVIEAMESASELEKKLAEKENHLKESEPIIQKDVEQLKAKIEACASEIQEAMARFAEGLARLSPEVKSRFEKTIKAKEGKAIAALDGNTCGVCHTAIPVHIVIEASANAKAVHCTNCGRFIYKKEDT